MLIAKDLVRYHGAQVVLGGVSVSITPGTRLGVVGPNGIGKSTLLKIVVAGLEPNSGTHEWGHAVNVGYFAQDHHDLLNDPKLTPLSFVWDACPTEPTNYVRGHLGRMLFSGDDVEKSVASLSGGEAARVIFARLSVEKPNVLVLDEPTNHLDLETIEALLEALSVYEGTLIFVSHDRYFVGRLATRVIELKADGLVDFKGTYDEYIEREGDDHLDVETVELRAKREKKSLAADDAKLTWEERKKQYPAPASRRASRRPISGSVAKVANARGSPSSRSSSRPTRPVRACSSIREAMAEPTPSRRRRRSAGRSPRGTGAAAATRAARWYARTRNRSA